MLVHNVYRNMPKEQLARLAEDEEYRAGWEELERRKCADPKNGLRYLARNYGVHIDASGVGPQPWDMWDYQDEIFIEELQGDDDFDVLKPRRVGFTLTYAHYALQKAGMRSDTPAASFLIISIGQKEAAEVLATIRNINYCLPEFLKVKIGADKTKDERGRLSKDTQNAFTFPDRDGAKITSLPCTGTTGRSLTASDVLLDEIAHYPNKKAPSIVASVEPTVEGGGRIVTGSTANGKAGDGEEFYRRWTEADEDPEMKAIFIPYWKRPGRDDEWKRKKIKRYGEAMFKQEYPANAEEAFAVNSENRALITEHLYSSLELGKKFDKAWDEGEINIINGEVYPGVDWGKYSTCDYVIEPKKNVLYLRHEILTEEWDAEDFSKLAIDEAEKIGTLTIIHYDSGGAGFQSNIQMRKAINQYPYKIKTQKLSFGAHKGDWLDFIKLLLRNTHDGDEEWVLAISENCPITFRQLIEAETDDLGKLSKKDDHNRDALFCCLHPFMKKYYREEAKKARKEKNSRKKKEKAGIYRL